MAKVTGPLLSLSAHGAFAKTLIFRKHGNMTVVIPYNKPTGEKSILQNAQRVLMKQARLEWRALTKTEKQTWRDKERYTLGISGYNLFIQHYLKQNSFVNPNLYGFGTYNNGFYTNRLDYPNL